MLDLNELLVFAGVADRLSFSEAAQALGLPASSVSRKVAALERRLGVALLHRTTRHVRLTAAGASYHQHCRAVLAAAEAAEAAVAPHRGRAAGRAAGVNASTAFGAGGAGAACRGVRRHASPPAAARRARQRARCAGGRRL